MIITMSDDKNSIDIDPGDMEVVVVGTEDRGVQFVSERGEFLEVNITVDGFVIEYLDTEDVVQTWSLRDGFVRRLSLKGRTVDNNNVVPIKRG